MKKRHTFILFLIFALVTPFSGFAQTKAERIANAMTAAPSSITAGATILDWPANDGEEMPILREGKNGWTCMPDIPATDGNDPVCVDATWLGFIEAMNTKTEPSVDRVGIGYMVAPGGAYGSNADPYATAATDGNQWGYDPPHLMIVVPDASALEGLPKTRGSGPYVMWAGTPYAHIMAPVSDGKKK